jgi:3-mercaptopyruvate sulfurtransferase SseA
VTTVPYKILSSKEFNASAGQGKSYHIVDLRSDSIFRGISTEKTKAEGHFDDAVNMPFEKLTSNSTIAMPGKPILLVDEYGDESPEAAKLLYEKGYKDVSILFDGMDGWVDYTTNTTDKIVVKWTRNISYTLLPADDFNKMIANKKEFTLIDVRTKDEFNNASKNYWQNIGQIKGSINIPFTELKTNNSLPQSRDAVIILYGFNSQPEIFEAAKWLNDQGYKNVSILQGGIWSLRWTSHNIKGKADLNNLLVNVPPENE